jgi:MFS family permease
MAEGTLGDRWLLALCTGRALLYALFMVYAASIPVLLEAWSMSATQAGTISGAFMLAYAASLVLASWLADRIGAKRVFLASAWLTGVGSLAFGFLARDYTSALLLYVLIGAVQGGSYGPVVMIFADRYRPAVRGGAVGLLIASTSVGYAFSLVAAGALLGIGGYETAFVVTGCLPLVGTVVCTIALRGFPNRIHQRPAGGVSVRSLVGNRDAMRLIVGYTGHSWELLGMWQWLPAFLAASLALSGALTLEAAAMGAWFSALMHLCGSVASSRMGSLSDRLGRRRVLVFLGIAGAVVSFGIGWLVTAPFALLLILALVYGFLTVGDSPVMSTALTEAVSPSELGTALATRSLTGFTAGAIAPVLFGTVLDLTMGLGSPTLSWGLAFVSLGLGGAVAAICALGLGRAGAEPGAHLTREEASP